MNRDQTPSSPGDAFDLPDELRDYRDVDALLNALAAADRAAGDVDLEHRVWGGSLGQLHAVADTDAAMTRAAEMDREAAPAALEARVFEASRSELVRRHEPVLARINAAGITRTRIWGRRVSIAAAFALVAAVGVWLGRPAPSSSNSGPPLASSSVQSMSTEALKASLANDFDILLAAMGDSAATETTTSESGFQAEWLDELVDEGRAS